MSTNFRSFAPLVLCFCLIALFAGSYALAQNTLTGEWNASVKSEEPDKINLSFERHTSQGGRHQTGTTFSLDQLQGLGREQVAGSGRVKFSIVREAGTIECEGNFQQGKGSGTFRFTPNPNFVAAMKSRGFDFESSSASDDHHDIENRLFAATTLNVTTALADDLLSANLGKLDVNDLFKATIFKIDSKFMREMKASGFPNLKMEDLVKARIFKIDADFVSRVTQMGFDKEPFESLVKMQIFKITPEFVTDVRNEGLANLTVEDLVKMRIFKIDGEFIRQAKAEGLPLDVERLVQKRIGVHGR